MADMILPTEDVLTLVLAAIRKRIEDARANGQKVRIDAREAGRSVVSFDEIRRRSVEDVVANVPTGFEVHIYIEPKQ